MDPLVSRLKTPEECRIFMINAGDKGRQDLMQEARIRCLQLKANHHLDISEVERECLMAVYAYEEVLAQKNGRKTKANRTWQVIKRYGVVAGIERLVCKQSDPSGFTVLSSLGLADYLFENVVLRNADAFSEEAVISSKARLASLGHG